MFGCKRKQEVKKLKTLEEAQAEGDAALANIKDLTVTITYADGKIEKRTSKAQVQAFYNPNGSADFFITGNDSAEVIDNRFPDDYLLNFGANGVLQVRKHLILSIEVL